MNKRILLSGVSILSTLALIGGATFAYFTGTATSSGNVFAAGTFNLLLSDSDETALATISSTWNSTNMAPGANPITATMQLRNGGTVAGDNVHLKASNSITDNLDPELGVPMSELMEITVATYDGADILPLIPDTNLNGRKDLDDLDVLGDGPEIGTLLNTGVDHPLVMTIQLHSSADNTYQSDQVTTTFTTTLHQVSSV